MSASEISNIVVGIFIIIGAFLSLVSAFGLYRLPDIYTRSHAASKATTLGVLVILTGAFIFFWANEGYISAKLLLGIVFVFITSPVAGHLISRAAYHSKVPLCEQSVRDDLKHKK